MKYLNGNHGVEAKGKRYNNHPTEDIILPKRDPPKPLRTQYQLQNETNNRKSHKIFENDNNVFEFKSYRKRKSIKKQKSWKS